MRGGRAEIDRLHEQPNTEQDPSFMLCAAFHELHRFTTVGPAKGGAVHPQQKESTSLDKRKNQTQNPTETMTF